MVNPDISTKIDHLTLEEPFWMVYVNKPRRTYANDIHKVSSSFSLHVKENVPCQFGVMASLKGDPFRKKEGWWVPGERPVGRLKRLPPVINRRTPSDPLLSIIISARAQFPHVTYHRKTPSASKTSLLIMFPCFPAISLSRPAFV